MTSLNPVFTIGEQIAESLRLHQGLGRERRCARRKRCSDQVRIPQAEECSRAIRTSSPAACARG